MRRAGLVVAVLAVVLGTASACPPRDPCGRLAPPSAADVQSALGGSEVERELDDVECVVVVTNGVGRWSPSTD